MPYDNTCTHELPYEVSYIPLANWIIDGDLYCVVISSKWYQIYGHLLSGGNSNYCMVLTNTPGDKYQNAGVPLRWYIHYYKHYEYSSCLGACCTYLQTDFTLISSGLFYWHQRQKLFSIETKIRWNLMDNRFQCDSSKGHHITTQFCSCHDSTCV